MAWVAPIYANHQIDKAGRLLMHPKFSTEASDTDQALEVIENFRASHGYPLLIFRLDLAKRARKIDSSALIAQRTKRLSSIESKLRRFPDMRLSHMQDIGGCRAVVNNVRAVRRLAASYARSRTNNKLLRTKDYIGNPRDSGYRGIHLIYSYQSDFKKEYTGLKIEIQLRSRLQHAWATAVETVDAFTGQALKGGRGEEDWTRFFALMAAYVAIKEKTALVPDTPQGHDLNDEILGYAQKLEVEGHLHAYSTAIKTFEQDVGKGTRYYLLQLDTKTKQIEITGYPARLYKQAETDYTQAEKRGFNKPEQDAVLVSVGSLSELKRAYPNYFADTHVFLKILEEVSGDT